MRVRGCGGGGFRIRRRRRGIRQSGERSFACFKLPYLPIHEAAVPEALPEVPHPTGVAVEEAEEKEITN